MLASLVGGFVDMNMDAGAQERQEPTGDERERAGPSDEVVDDGCAERRRRQEHALAGLVRCMWVCRALCD